MMKLLRCHDRQFPKPCACPQTGWCPHVSGAQDDRKHEFSPQPQTPTPFLQVRRVAIDTYRENVAYLHRDCAVYRAEGFQAPSKVEVRAMGNAFWPA